MRQFKVADRLTLRQGELQRYLNEVSSIKMVTPDEEYKIAVKASKGDLDAIDELVKINLRIFLCFSSPPIYEIFLRYQGFYRLTFQDVLTWWFYSH